MATLQRPRKPSQLVKIPKLQGNAIRPTGPKAINIKETIVGGYGDPPPGFVGGQNSITEWIVYWGIARILGKPQRDDIRKPPFFGGPPDWTYQVKFATRYTASQRTAVDFVVNYGRTTIGIRIQTEHFHLFTSSRQQAYDLIQRSNLVKYGMVVMDLYDYELLGDPSGAKAIISIKRILGMIELPNPLAAGTAIRGSRLKVLQ